MHSDLNSPRYNSSEHIPGIRRYFNAVDIYFVIASQRSQRAAQRSALNEKKLCIYWKRQSRIYRVLSANGEVREVNAQRARVSNGVSMRDLRILLPVFPHRVYFPKRCMQARVSSAPRTLRIQVVGNGSSPSSLIVSRLAGPGLGVNYWRRANSDSAR